MLVLAKRGVNTVNIRLRTYDTRQLDRVTGLPKQNGWDGPYNLFGNTVPDFPILFRDSDAPVPRRFANFQSADIQTMHQLIARYNNGQFLPHLRIDVTQSLSGELAKLKALVRFSKEVAQMVGRQQLNVMNQPRNDIVVVTAKDLAILALFLLNVCMVTILITKCTKSTKSRGKKVKYEPVSFMSESELVSVQ